MKKTLPKAKRQSRAPKKQQKKSMHYHRIGAYILIFVSLIALCLTAWRYFYLYSGIAGTGGALLAIFGAFMLMVAGLILLKLPHGVMRIMLLILSFIGALGTFFALLFLHGWISAFFIAIGFLALIYESFACVLRRVL